jgi:hypothetical protein
MCTSALLLAKEEFTKFFAKSCPGKAAGVAADMTAGIAV